MDHSEHSDVIGKVYEAALDDLSWSDVLCDIADFCGAENAALVVADELAGYSSVIAPRADPNTIAAYADVWWQHDPTALATATAPVGRITTLADTGHGVFYRSSFYNEFWRHSGLGAERIASNLIIGERMFASVVLQAPNARDEIEAAHLDRFALVIPHLIRAVGISRKLSRMELQQATAQHREQPGCTGVIVVDHAARVVFADPGAESVLATSVGLVVNGGVLRLGRSEANDRLHAAIAGWVTGEHGLEFDTPIELPRSNSRSPLQLKVLPCRRHIAQKLAVTCGSPTPSAMVIIHDPDIEREARLSALKESYHLTQAEAVLAIELLKGDGRAAAAQRCGISINTARTHLMRVFEKIGVSRQAELVRLLRQ